MVVPEVIVPAESDVGFELAGRFIIISAAQCGFEGLTVEVWRAIVSEGGGSVAGGGVFYKVALSGCKVVVWVMSKEGGLNRCVSVDAVAGGMRLVDIVDGLRS